MLNKELEILMIFKVYECMMLMNSKEFKNTVTDMKNIRKILRDYII